MTGQRDVSLILFWWNWGLNPELHDCKAGSPPPEPVLQSSNAPDLGLKVRRPLFYGT